MSLTNRENPILFDKVKSLEGKKVRMKNIKEDFGGGDWVGTLEIIRIGNFVRLNNLESSPVGFKERQVIVHSDDWNLIEIA